MFSVSFVGLILVGVIQQVFSQVISAPAFRAIHASADTHPGEVYINGTKVLSNIGFGKSSAFLSIPLGEAVIKATYVGRDEPIIEGDVVFAGKRWYSAIAIGTSVGAGNEKLQGLVIADLANAPASGKGKIRVVHAAVDVPFVDVYAVAPGVQITDSDPIIKHLGFGHSSPISDELALEVPVGVYVFYLATAGTKISFYQSSEFHLFGGDDYLLTAVKYEKKIVKLLAVDVFGYAQFF